MRKPILSKAPDWATHIVELGDGEEEGFGDWWFVNTKLDRWSFANGYDIFPSNLGNHLRGGHYRWTALNVDLENK